jgi:hypothetical protein
VCGLINKASAPAPFPLPYPGPMLSHGECLRTMQVAVRCGIIPRTGNLPVDRSATRFVLQFPFVNKGQPVVLDRRRESLTFSTNPSVDGSACIPCR